MACFSMEDLADLLLGRIDEPRTVEIDSHLSSGCTKCSENYHWLRKVLATAAQDHSFEFPEEVLKWSVEQFKVASAGLEKKRFVAQLVFDSLAGPRLAD